MLLHPLLDRLIASYGLIDYLNMDDRKNGDSDDNDNTVRLLHLQQVALSQCEKNILLPVLLYLLAVTTPQFVKHFNRSGSLLVVYLICHRCKEILLSHAVR